jgi:hypothetical protein
MTIVMEEDVFSSSLSSLSSLSPAQTNYQTLIGRNETLNTSNTSLNSSLSGSSSSSSLSSITTIQTQQTSANATNSPPQTNAPVILDNVPYAIFLFRSNSSLELFEERRISLDKPCKIGRSVAKIRPEPNNAIFDCKVLSRNHALLWQENGKVYHP